MRRHMIRHLAGILAVASSVLWLSQPILGQEHETGATVEVQNNFETSIDVFVESGRFDRRIGAVEPLSKAELPLPDWYVRRDVPVQLFVVGNGEDLQSQSFEVRPGETIGMIVPSPPESRPEPMTAQLPRELLSETTLTVENQRDEAVVIYGEEDSFSVRLGKVAPNSRETLEFPESLVMPFNTITVLVDPRNGRDLETYPLEISPGEHLGLELTDS
jgi:hypothetical protein